MLIPAYWAICLPTSSTSELVLIMPPPCSFLAWQRLMNSRGSIQFVVQQSSALHEQNDSLIKCTVMHISQIIFIFPTMTLIFTAFKSWDGSLDFWCLIQKTAIPLKPVYLAQALTSVFYPEVALGLEVPWVKMFCIKRTIDVATYFKIF